MTEDDDNPPRSERRPTLRLVAATLRVELPRIERSLEIPRDVEDRILQRVLTSRWVQRASA